MAIKINGSGFPTKASDQFKPRNDGYGQGGFGGASSDTPGQRTRAALTVNNDDTDPALAKLKAQGDRDDNPMVHDQLREVAGSRPVTYGMKPSTPSNTPRVPGVLDAHCDLSQKKPC